MQSGRFQSFILLSFQKFYFTSVSNKILFACAGIFFNKKMSLEVLSSMSVLAITNAVHGYVAYCNCLGVLPTGLIQ